MADSVTVMAKTILSVTVMSTGLAEEGVDKNERSDGR